MLGSLSEEERVQAFQQGRTGYPMVDACMRCLLSTGWLIFRMRCMLVSFAVFNLWLDWRCIAGHLAQCFLDYEPGIHYPQLQMQAGTTGCDLRCYSVIRQAKDQDPKAEFIKRYVAELRELPADAALEPWKIKYKGLAPQYPARIVDDIKTSKASKTVISAYQQWFQDRGNTNGANPPSIETLLAGKQATQPAQNKNGRASKIAGTACKGPPAKRSRVAEEEDHSDADHDDNEVHNEEGHNSVEQDRLLALLRGEGATVAANLSEGGCWSCPRCTLINGLDSAAGSAPLFCEACGGPRPLKSSTAHTGALSNDGLTNAAATVIDLG